jgi:hypothetical protein
MRCGIGGGLVVPVETGVCDRVRCGIASTARRRTTSSSIMYSRCKRALTMRYAPAREQQEPAYGMTST